MVNADISKRVEEITLHLAEQQSVVDTPDEIVMAERVYDVMAKIDYFKKHPEKLYFLPCKNDALGRKIVIAIVNGEKKPTDKTVVLIGHMDTVGISDYGNLQEYATKPFELMEKFKDIKLPPEAKKDLESGEYIFGRGIFDMKAGDAVIIAVMEEITRHIEDFEGNLIYAAVCDEEGNSTGMLNFVPELTRIQEEKGYDYLAMIDTDYMVLDYEGDPDRYIHIGTVGKIMPTFYMVGKETHVGEAFMGLDPNQVLARITDKMGMNTDYSEVVEGQVSMPPVSLKLRDRKTEYSCQTAKRSILMFSCATEESTPDQVMEQMMKEGNACFEEIVSELNEKYEKWCKLANQKFIERPWKARTMSFKDLYSKVRESVGPKLDTMVADYAKKLHMDKTIDSRDSVMMLVDFVHELWEDKDPILIVYITPPYYPHIYVKGDKPRDQKLLGAVGKAISETKTDYHIVQKKFLPCISDLSYAAAPREPEAIAAIKENVPGYGIIYDLPFEDMQKLDLPVVDIGVAGKDAHKFTERVEKNYSFNVAPELVYKTIMNLLED